VAVSSYRRTARAGDTVFVAGMVGRAADGAPLTDIGSQVDRAIARLREALAEESLELSDVVRLRVFLTDIATWSAPVGPALDAAFGGTFPPATVVGVSALVEPWMGIELEVEAAVRGSQA
jgi:enamine deaminase RidA (YjgF/YER057c/UK114 family)